VLICGVPEAFGTGAAQVKLPSPLVTFRVDAAPPGITIAQLQDVLMYAWKGWQDVIGIRVDLHTNTKTDPTQFVIVAQMDGRSGVLADQELPYKPALLRMRLDPSERWSLADKPEGDKISLPTVLRHENGHCLGMQHISADGDKDLMNPTYDPLIYLPQEDDISYGRKLYGGPIPIPAPPSPPGQAPAILPVSVEITAYGGTYRAKGNAKRIA
jgi:hypothetical protein